MIGFSLQISNPFCKTWASINNIFLRNYKITKYKNLEIQVAFCSNLVEFFSINIYTYWTGRDHAGPSFDLTILWFYVSIKLYDGRHWDATNECWEKHDERAN